MVGTFSLGLDMLFEAFKQRRTVSVELGGVEHKFFVQSMMIPEPRVGGPVKFNEMVEELPPATSVTLRLIPEASDIGSIPWLAQFDCASGRMLVSAPVKRGAT